MTLVELLPDEVAVIDFYARRVQEKVKRTGARNRLAGRQTTLAEERAARGAELAVAKHMNLYPTFLGGRGVRADVGLHYEVRSSKYPTAHLYVHPEDPLDHRFILVVAISDEKFSVVGSMFGRAAERYEQQIDQYGHPCWRIPQRDLRPV